MISISSLLIRFREFRARCFKDPRWQNGTWSAERGTHKAGAGMAGIQGNL